MVGTDLKAETMTLMEKRDSTEAEMNAIIQRLCCPGGPGLSGNLLDSEGFPRADIDIPFVRADRHRLAELNNIHKDLTEKIDQNIQLLHAAKSSPKTSTIINSGKETDSQMVTAFNGGGSASLEHVHTGNATVDMNASVKVPFAIVDEIAEASPAAEDGLQLGDQIVKFGNVDCGDSLLSRLASEVQTNEGCRVIVVLMRQGALMSLSVTPRTWQGRGLLGCHFRIL